jgi:ABC-type Co2+ transport system permease subunit
MLIMEGFLPIEHAVGWSLAALPYWPAKYPRKAKQTKSKHKFLPSAAVRRGFAK